MFAKGWNWKKKKTSAWNKLLSILLWILWTTIHWEWKREEEDLKSFGYLLNIHLDRSFLWQLFFFCYFSSLVLFKWAFSICPLFSYFFCTRCDSSMLFIFFYKNENDAIGFISFQLIDLILYSIHYFAYSNWIPVLHFNLFSLSMTMAIESIHLFCVLPNSLSDYWCLCEFINFKLMESIRCIVISIVHFVVASISQIDVVKQIYTTIVGLIANVNSNAVLSAF